MSNIASRADYDDLSDMEESLLQELAKIRKLKERKNESKNELVNSDEEEDPRQVNDRGQSTSYFNQSLSMTAATFKGPTKAEKLLRKKIQANEDFKNGLKHKLRSEKEDTFVNRLQTHQQDIRKLEDKQRQKDEEILLNRMYSFDLLPDFKPLDKNVNEKDYFSGKYLSKRYIEESTLKELIKQMSDIKLMRVENILSNVIAPDFKPPLHANYILFGILSFKSERKTTNDSKKSKFMTLHISNFKQQLTLTLLGNAFEKYWKLRVGNVLAILNPTIFPFQDRSGFSLSIKDDSLCILEIGHSRDFGYCKSTKKDGNRCSTPVDLSKHEYCDYHVELQYNKTASKRVELGGNFRMFDPKDDNGQKQAMFMGEGRKGGMLKGQMVTDSLAPKYDRKVEISKLYFSNPDASKAFFDDSYSNPKFLDDIKNEKLVRKRRKEEKMLRRKLSELKGGQNLKDSSLDTPEIKKQKRSASSLAFNPKIIDRIGFDPTKKLFQMRSDSDRSTSLKKSNELLESLRKETAKSKEKKLSLSKDDKLEKKRKWNSTLKRMDEYTSPKKKKNLDKFEGLIKTNKKREVELDDDDSGDDFSDGELRRKYTELKNSPKKKIQSVPNSRPIPNPFLDEPMAKKSVDMKDLEESVNPEKLNLDNDGNNQF